MRLQRLACCTPCAFVRWVPRDYDWGLHLYKSRSGTKQLKYSNCVCCVCTVCPRVMDAAAACLEHRCMYCGFCDWIVRNRTGQTNREKSKKKNQYRQNAFLISLFLPLSLFLSSPLHKRHTMESHVNVYRLCSSHSLPFHIQSLRARARIEGQLRNIDNPSCLL